MLALDKTDLSWQSSQSFLSDCQPGTDKRCCWCISQTHYLASEVALNDIIHDTKTAATTCYSPLTCSRDPFYSQFLLDLN